MSLVDILAYEIPKYLHFTQTSNILTACRKVCKAIITKHMNAIPSYSAIYCPMTCLLFDKDIKDCPEGILGYHAQDKYISPNLCIHFGLKLSTQVKSFLNYRCVIDPDDITYEIYRYEIADCVYNPRSFICSYISRMCHPDIILDIIKMFQMDPYKEFMYEYRRLVRVYRRYRRIDFVGVLQVFLRDPRCTSKMINKIPYIVHDDNKYQGDDEIFYKHRLYKHNLAQYYTVLSSIGVNERTFTSHGKKTKMFTKKLFDKLLHYGFGEFNYFYCVCADAPQNWRQKLAKTLEEKRDEIYQMEYIDQDEFIKTVAWLKR